MKRILAAVFLIVVMCTNTVFAQANIFDTFTITEEQKNDLYNLGIMIGDENGDLRLDDQITRAEAAKMICVAGNISPMSTKTEESFSDVSDSHWAYGYIYALKDAGIIEGREDGTFHPQDNITNEEIVKMIVLLLGYRELAESLGGYPAGYTGAASEIGITNNMGLIPGVAAVRKNVAVMICNSLDIPIMVKKSEGNDDGSAVYVILNGKNDIPFSSIRGTRGMIWDTTPSNIDRFAQRLAAQYPYKDGDVEKAISLYPDITYLTGIEKASDGTEYECPAIFDDRHAYGLLSAMTLHEAQLEHGETIRQIHYADYDSSILVPYNILGVLGCDVVFDKDNYVATISDEDTILEIIPNLVCMRKNRAEGYWVPLQVCARFIDDTLYVPLEAIISEFGFVCEENRIKAENTLSSDLTACSDETLRITLKTK